MTSIRYIVSNFDQSVRQIMSDINSWIANYDNGLIVGNVSEDDWWDIYLTLYALNILYSFEILYLSPIFFNFKSSRARKIIGHLFIFNFEPFVILIFFKT